MARFGSKDVWCLGALVALTACAFSEVAHLGFISLDDPDYVLQNQRVLRGLSWEGLRWALTTFHCGNWHPLTWLSLQLDSSLFGASAAGFHGTNALLHGAAACLLYLSLRELTGKNWPSFAAAALFAVHPLRVESVAWVAERKDVLSTFFGMAALFAYSRFPAKPSTGRRLAVAALFFASLLAKPMWVTFPILLCLVDYWRSKERGGFLVSFRQALRGKEELFVLSALSGAVTLLAQSAGGAVVSVGSIGPVFRFYNAVVSFWAYLAAFFWPVNLVAYRPLESVSAAPGIGVGALAGIALLFAWAFRARETRRHRLVGALWYLVTLLPVLGLIQVGAQQRADRYTYLPSVGLLLFLLWEIESWGESARRAGAFAAMAAILICVPLTRAQTAVWKDSLTLWQHAVSVEPFNDAARAALCIALYEKEKRAEAEQCAKDGLAIMDMEPRDQGVAYQLGPRVKFLGLLGTIYVEGNREEEGRKAFEQVLAMVPTEARTNRMLGDYWVRHGDSAKAMEHYARALSGGEVGSDLRRYEDVLRVSAGTGEGKRAGQFLDEVAAALTVQGRYEEAARVRGWK
jgi:protein O-mannosyl-transferase